MSDSLHPRERVAGLIVTVGEIRDDVKELKNTLNKALERLEKQERRIQSLQEARKRASRLIWLILTSAVGLACEAVWRRLSRS